MAKGTSAGPQTGGFWKERRSCVAVRGRVRCEKKMVASVPSIFAEIAAVLSSVEELSSRSLRSAEGALETGQASPLGGALIRKI